MKTEQQTQKQIRDTAFAIINNGILLPFTIRSTKRQCVSDYEKDSGVSWSFLKKQVHVRKVIIQTV